MSYERFKQQMDFILEVDKLKEIYRQTYISSANRKENDTEHSWHLALMAMLMAEHMTEKPDILRTISMVIIHDIVEIDAGDTYAYDVKGNETKRAREEAAADRIFNLLPKDQAIYMRELWEEFEAKETPEAKFANALDKLQPLMLNDATNGKAWLEHDVCKSQILNRNKSIEEASENIWKYITETIDANVNKNNIKDC